MKGKIEIPTNCPSCNSKLERVNDQLFCNNELCGAVNIKRIEGFIKALKIKGLGIKTIEKLDITDIHDIYSIDRDTSIDAIGEKLTDKLLSEIEKSKVTTVTQFLSAFSIKLIGNTSASKVLTENIGAITYKQLVGYGLGDKAASNLYDWVITEYPYYEDLPITFRTEIKTNEDSKYSVCITGRNPGYTKAEMTSQLNTSGVKVTSAINKQTTHLICGVRKNSAKETRAEQLNMPIVTFEEFKEILND
jgi:NAD-dependent DNA ligase